MKCKRCEKVIRSVADHRNFERYYPGFCSYNCQEWWKLEEARRWLDSKRAASPTTTVDEVPRG